MIYEIQSKSDFITGSYLIIRIPEKDLDRNALYTIQSDRPDFILPFHYKSINDEVEFTYKIGNCSKFQYFAGDVSSDEYIRMWQNILTPLLDCGDWFMNPCSFMLNTDHLYFDKVNKTVVYLYVPTLRGCSGYEAFNTMTADISKMMTVSDAILENKVLKSILENFNPIEFLKMLNDHVSENEEIRLKHPDSDDAVCDDSASDDSLKPCDVLKPENKPESTVSFIVSDDDSIIEKSLQGLQEPEKGSGKYRMFSSRSKRKKVKQENLKKAEKSTEAKQTAPVRPEPVKPTGVKQAEIIDITHTLSVILRGPGLKYIGRAHLPQAIEIPIAEGEIFSIGRFDAAVGKQQSNFEFDKKTKAVSRRHAVIERDPAGYKIIDLSSSAGTFINDKKLPPNTPCGLERGCRVSFGNSGADYVWEVS